MIDRMNELYGGIEFGGTKTICAVGDVSGRLFAQATIPTTSVEETLQAVFDFFDERGPIQALGVGSFGPLGVNRHSENYGSIYNAPKSGWKNVRLKDLLKDHFDVLIEFDLDVNCAAVGELNFGVAQDVDNFIYLTLGTGIGGALVMNKQLVHGILNLEMGHMHIPHEPFMDGFKGTCNYHGDCLEGIASGYAIQQHYGRRAEEIESAEVWGLEANYIAMALNNIIMTVGPEKIVLGGGLTHQAGFVEQIRSRVSTTVNGYMPLPSLGDYIVTSSGETNGVLGAIKLAAAS